MKRTILALIALCTTYAGISAPPEAHNTDIIQITSFKQAETRLAQCDKHTLVLFDIDLTLIRPVNQLHKALEDRQLKEIILKKFPVLHQEEACEYCESMLYKQCKEQLMEPELPTILQTLKETYNATVLGLTVRSTGAVGVIEDIPKLTSERLAGLEIQFSQHISNADYLNKETEKREARLHDGILFCDRTPKGDVLSRFLSTQPGDPFDTILFFDDLREHLESVIQCCQQRNIPITPYLYERKKNIPAQDIPESKLHALIGPIVDSYSEQAPCT